MKFEDIKQIVYNKISLKSTLEVGDIVIFNIGDLIIYAHVSDIERDKSKRDEWWFVTFFMLTVPPKKLTWILRTEQMTGKEVFTMEGSERFFAPVDLSEEPEKFPLKLVK